MTSSRKRFVAGVALILLIIGLINSWMTNQSWPKAPAQIQTNECRERRHIAFQGTGRLATTEAIFRLLWSIGYYDLIADPCVRVHVFVLFEKDDEPTATIHAIKNLFIPSSHMHVSVIFWQDWASYLRDHAWAGSELSRLEAEYLKLHVEYPTLSWAANTPVQFYKRRLCNELRRNYSREHDIRYERVFRTRMDFAPVPGDVTPTNVLNRALGPQDMIAWIDTVSLGPPSVIDVEADFILFHPPFGYLLHVNRTPELKAKYPTFRWNSTGWWFRPEVQLKMWLEDHGIRLNTTESGMTRYQRDALAGRPHLLRFSRLSTNHVPTTYRASQVETRAARLLNEVLTNASSSRPLTACDLFNLTLSASGDVVDWSTFQMLRLTFNFEPLVPPFGIGLRCTPCVTICDEANLIPTRFYDQFAIDILHYRPQGSRVILVEIGPKDGINPRLRGIIGEELVTDQRFAVDTWDAAKVLIREKAVRGDYVMVAVSAEATQEYRLMATDMLAATDHFLFTTVTEAFCFVSIRRYFTEAPLELPQLKMLDTVVTAASDLRHSGVRARLLPWA